ncbi:MAG: hypothetical protein LBE48_03755 [Methanomassiliicoccaceae archaeon]|jgi:tetratricopeptide (TPR) repeat protein|nr:hypothetical protein [Methanomassiliicoccaceae archaeon]
MQRSEPVLTDPDDIRIWNKTGSPGPEDRKKKKQGKLSILAVIDDALATSKQMHSAVLVKILRSAAYEEISDLGSAAIKVLDMCRPGDMYPIMEAADIVIRDGNIDISRSLMKKMTDVPDTAFREYLEGMLASRSKDNNAAVEHLIRSNAIDPSFMRTYDALISLEADKGWDVLRNIHLIMSGERPRDVRTADKELTELQDIYDKWYNGDKGAARKKLESSSAYSSGHLDFLLAAARMTGDIGEYSRSLELYDRILSQYLIDSIIVEKANILTALGKRSDSLNLLETLDKDSRRNRSIMECTLKALASENSEKEFSSYADKFMSSEHGDKDGHILVCGLMSQIGLNDRASKILHMLLPMFPDDPHLHLMNAGNEMMLGREASAMRSADRAVKISPKTADGYCVRAEIHLRYGRTKDALKDGERALKCNADHIGSLAVMRKARIQNKEYDKALEICRRTLIYDPYNADALKDTAYALDMTGKRQEAVEEYKNALRVKNDTKMLISVISTLIEGGRSDDAADIAEEFISDDEKSADIWCLRGNSEYQSARFAEASRSYTKALETRPHDARLWHSKGLAEEMGGMLRESESSYDRAVIIDLDNTEFWLSKAIVQEKRGDLKGSVLSLNRVISGSPDNVFALVRKSKILAYAGMTDEAMFFLDCALRVDSRNLGILNIKKNIHKRDGSYEKVIDVCRTILKVDRKNIGALTDLAETYQKMGRHDDALKVLSDV